MKILTIENGPSTNVCDFPAHCCRVTPEITRQFEGTSLEISMVASRWIRDIVNRIESNRIESRMMFYRDMALYFDCYCRGILLCAAANCFRRDGTSCPCKSHLCLVYPFFLFLLFIPTLTYWVYCVWGVVRELNSFSQRQLKSNRLRALVAVVTWLA